MFREEILNVLATSCDKVGVVSLEEAVGETGQKLAAMNMNKNPADDTIPLADLLVSFDKIFTQDVNGEKRIMLLDHQGAITDNTIMDQLEYMCLKGCKYIFIDHITIMVSEGVVGGASSITGDFLDITRNTLQYNGVTASSPKNPANSIDSGNTLGWFGVTVELSTASSASTNEAAGAGTNFPVLLVNGIIGTSTTVQIADLTTGTATATTDYTFTTPQTITIPAGTYDGTLGTAIAITAPTIITDSSAEGPETINFTLQSAGANASIGDASGNATTQTTTTYTITDDDPAIVEFSTASSLSTNEVTANNFPVLLITGYLGSSATINVVDLGTGTATSGGTDYLFSTPQTVTIPAGQYDGTLGTAVTITVPGLNNDAIVDIGETINFQLQNPTGSLSIGDANGNSTTQTNHTYTITDDDGAAITYSATTLSESITNNGTIGTTLTLTLSGDIFTAGPFTSGVEYTITNAPAGLTGVVTRTSATTATLTLTGTATTPTNASDISNLTLVFANSAFTGNNAGLVGNASYTGLSVDFFDVTAVYAGNFTESTLNNGSLTGSRTVTLTGDTYAATLTEGVHFTLTNKLRNTSVAHCDSR
jgi:hypothetical protein